MSRTQGRRGRGVARERTAVTGRTRVRITRRARQMGTTPRVNAIRGRAR